MKNVFLSILLVTPTFSSLYAKTLEFTFSRDTRSVATFTQADIVGVESIKITVKPDLRSIEDYVGCGIAMTYDTISGEDPVWADTFAYAVEVRDENNTTIKSSEANVAPNLMSWDNRIFVNRVNYLNPLASPDGETRTYSIVSQYGKTLDKAPIFAKPSFTSNDILRYRIVGYYCDYIR